jgi:hypothetical protein
MDILVPDAESEYPFNPSISSIHFVGEEIHPGEGVSAIPSSPVYALVAGDESGSHRVRLKWEPDPHAEAYEVYSSPTLDTPFPDSPEPMTEVGGGAPVTRLPAGTTEAFAPYNSNTPDRYYAVSSIVNGTPTLDHLVALASTGSGAEDWGYCFEADAATALDIGTAGGQVCLVQSGDASHAYLMTHAAADFSTPPDLTHLKSAFETLASSCAASGKASVGGIAFEGPADEDPGSHDFAMVSGSVGVAIPLTKFGVGVKGELLQARDQSTFGLIYSYDASGGVGCLTLPITVEVRHEADFRFASHELTGSEKDQALGILSDLRSTFTGNCRGIGALLNVAGIVPNCSLAEIPRIGKPAIGLVKGTFSDLYMDASEATRVPQQPPETVGWTQGTSSSNTDFTNLTSGDLSATAKGIGAIGIGTYEHEPQGVPALRIGSSYFDAKVSKDSIFGAVVVTDCNIGDANSVQWLDSDTNQWQEVSGAMFRSGSPRCVEITIGPDTSPSLSQLTGTVFGLSPPVPVCESKPTIEVQPTSATVTAPAEALFEVKEGAVASGCSAASIQWQESTTGGSTWNTTFGAGASGMTSGALKIAPTVVGESGLKLRAVLTNAYGETDSLPVTLTVAPELLKPVNLEAPQLTGTAAVGDALSCSQGRWGNAPTSFAYSWRRDGTPIGGESSSSYSVQAADAGHGLICEVTASNIKGSVSAMSNELQIPVPESAGLGGGGPGDSSGPGGGGPGSSGGAGGGGSSTTPSPAPSKSRSTSLKCRKGYTKKKVRGKTKCVKSKKKHHHH